ncbi:4-hydroxy-3-methylbut-2-en-1-yl diphosphate reductase [Desulfosarcina sp. BuS5]|uniref:4-hydroxy-3-methylbut-2-enyl diphosphate reductase n=1 Tax=Desulfosarcina sp. BuS5 TaxID=933262 RepID=UPI0004890EFC|nr:4-hydroxy-3-methylbut-2-enyl diphosphate reductase [Desulfosarcina sp. BuS5]WDN87226.1 4-hydroxy-3-methylbut-2-en-1-yl diphosphate reductase [Desulfosarcina sp. BuS5]
MKVIIAETAGFCMGVHRAVEMAMAAPDKHDPPIYTFGPLIHNSNVLHCLEEKGIFVIGEIPDKISGTILIRAHGIPPDIKAKLIIAGFNVIDATCPRVIKVQTIIARHAAKGYVSIIIGDKDHPEVVGLLGFARGNGHVVNNINHLQALPSFKKAIIVFQTTQNITFSEKVKEWASINFPHYIFFNTICNSTIKRQSEAQLLSKSVDAVIVIGGHNSGNTQRLAEIAGETGKPVFHIETKSEMDIKMISKFNSIGITAGASTPEWVIKQVCRALKTIPGNTNK